MVAQGIPAKPFARLHDVTVHPLLACNLGCDYCYQNAERTSEPVSLRKSGAEWAGRNTAARFAATLLLALALAGLGLPTVANSAIVVNSLADDAAPPAGTVTLRSALATAASGETIVFANSLNGGTIELSIIGNAHSRLKAEVMGMMDTPSGPVSYLVGYLSRDYGKSALEARKNVVIDASALPSGITLKWVGGEANPARVLAVYGDLTLTHVTITGGMSVAEALPPNPDDPYDQLSTHARGAGLAVWGVAHLEHCTLYNNHCKRASTVPARSRDSGVFGGGIYADIVEMHDCLVSGNSVAASGVSGGGVFAVGGAGSAKTISKIDRSAITGNHITGFIAYGGGVYSDGGGIGNRKTLELRNCTIARNLVDYPAPVSNSYSYWRGGGVYMSNGYLLVQSCTVVENEVHGVARTDKLGKSNLAGGIAATVGNAHAVESMTIGHSVIAGNTVWEFGGGSRQHDIFTGSLFRFRSMGYNRIGTIDFSQMLVPVGVTTWYSLCRRHYPKAGDEDGVDVADVLNLTSGITRSGTILSAGVDAPNPAVLQYNPRGNALDQVPMSSYSVSETNAEYAIQTGATDTFLAIVLARIGSHYGLGSFASDFTTDFAQFLASVDIDSVTPGLQPYTSPTGTPILTLAATQWFGPAATWPQELPNHPYIEFWHRLDSALRARNIPGMGQELLDDDAWTALFSSGHLTENPSIDMSVWTTGYGVVTETVDQLGTARPASTHADIGACEYDSPPLLGDLDGDGMDDAFELRIADANEADAIEGPAEVAPLDDFDHDGVPNLAEYHFGMDPTQGGQRDHLLVPGRADLDGQPCNTISYRRLIDMRAARGVVQQSGDLQHWTALDAAALQVVAAQDMGDGTEQVTLRVPPPTPETGRTFLRVVVETIP